jgi:hypothetical protein
MIFEKKITEHWQESKPNTMNQIDRLLSSETIWYFLGMPIYKKTVIKSF